MFKLNSLNSLRALRDLHASQSAGVRALTTCSPLILKQRNPLLSLSLRRRLPSHRRTICMSFETSRAAVISDLDCRMERMKNNCRKAAMETRQQQIQVDLGISPERWLCETLRTYKIVSCSKSEGITLERELLLRSKL